MFDGLASCIVKTVSWLADVAGYASTMARMFSMIMFSDLSTHDLNMDPWQECNRI
jgi:hypothetical protein